jgi:hypothetical protein
MTSQAVAPVLVCGLDANEVAAVLSHLDALGYQIPLAADFAQADTATHRPVESDAALHDLITHLRSVTAMQKLNSIEAYEFWRLISAGRRLMEPIRHPSGLATTEPAFVTVKPLGAGVHTPGKTR